MYHTPSIVYLIGGVIVAVLVLVVLVGVPLYMAYYYISQALSKEVRTRAAVLTKHTRDWEVDLPRSPGDMIADPVGADNPAVAAQWTNMFVTFETPKGRVELRVPEEVYITLEAGDEGTLTYKGERLKDFVRRAPR